MKNIVIYYFAVIAPLAVLFAFTHLGYINAKNLVLLFLFYLIIYRTYIDGLRLCAKNLINRKDIWKLAIPGSRSDYILDLYFDSAREKK